MRRIAAYLFYSAAINFLDGRGAQEAARRGGAQKNCQIACVIAIKHHRNSALSWFGTRRALTADRPGSN